MPAGGLRPQLVSPPAGADEPVAAAELETTAALGKGAAAGVDGALSEPPPQAVSSTGSSADRPSPKSRALKGLLFWIGTKLEVKVDCMNKLSVCPSRSHAVCCNQTKARV